jgi:hypothetical protein
MHIFVASPIKVAAPSKTWTVFAPSLNYKSLLLLIFIKWHSRWACRVAARVEYWRSICTCIPKRQQQCLNWKRVTRPSVSSIAGDLGKGLLPMERLLWKSYCIYQWGIVWLIRLRQHPKESRSVRTNPHEIRDLVRGAPYHEIWYSAPYTSMALSRRIVIVKC